MRENSHFTVHLIVILLVKHQRQHDYTPQTDTLNFKRSYQSPFELLLKQSGRIGTGQEKA